METSVFCFKSESDNHSATCHFCLIIDHCKTITDVVTTSIPQTGGLI